MPRIHSMLDLNLALQWHLKLLHVQGKSQSGIVFSGGMLLKASAFISVSRIVRT